MKVGFIGLALAAGMAMFASQASAAPIAPVGDNGPIVLVSGGCGPGWHRGPYGRCRPNFYGPRRCYWVRGPWGRPHRVCR